MGIRPRERKLPFFTRRRGDSVPPEIQADFDKKCKAMLGAALAKVPKVAACTIREPIFPEAVRQSRVYDRL